MLMVSLGILPVAMLLRAAYTMHVPMRQIGFPHKRWLSSSSMLPQPLAIIPARRALPEFLPPQFRPPVHAQAQRCPAPSTQQGVCSFCPSCCSRHVRASLRRFDGKNDENTSLRCLVDCGIQTRYFQLIDQQRQVAVCNVQCAGMYAMLCLLLALQVIASALVWVYGPQSRPVLLCRHSETPMTRFSDTYTFLI